MPHVLKDGADSVGLIGALSRVYVSIGEYSQEWLRDHNALVGGKPQRPFEVARHSRNRSIGKRRRTRVPNLSKFLMKLQGPKLGDAPGGEGIPLAATKSFCSAARSSSRRTARDAIPASSRPGGSATTKEQYLDWMRAEVQKPDFLDNNFLSTEERIPMDVIQTNAARALATNAVRGHVWDNFSSETYKTLPAAGEIDVHDLGSGSSRKFPSAAGGPGYYRVPSLIAVWATAPFLHNNALGVTTGDPSVAGRMAAFNDAAEKLLWPQKRLGLGIGCANHRRKLSANSCNVLASRSCNRLTKVAFCKSGPIPAGTPVDLLANADLDLSHHDLAVDRVKLFAKVQADLLKISLQKMDAPAARQRAEQDLVPDLMKISKCPDFVQDRGHYFGDRASRRRQARANRVHEDILTVTD